MKFAINPALISVKIESKRGGITKKLKILLQICLIASQINQKLRRKEENTLVLKGIFARKSWPFDLVEVMAMIARRSWPIT